MKNFKKIATGIVLGVSAYLMAFTPNFVADLKADNTLAGIEGYDLLAEVPEIESEETEEVVAPVEVKTSTDSIRSGRGGYRVADANYSQAPKTNDVVTSSANAKAIELAKKDDVAFEEAQKAKEEVAEKELVIEEVKSEGTEKVDTTVVVKDDGSLENLPTEEVKPVTPGIVTDNREVVDLGTIEFGDENSLKTETSSDTIVASTTTGTTTTVASSTTSTTDGGLDVIVLDDTEEDTPVVVGQDVSMVA